MSSQQELIKLNEVIAECTRLLSDQVKGWQNIVKEINNVNKSAPSSYIKMQREASKAILDLEKQEQEYQKTLQQKQRLEQQMLITERQRVQLSETVRKATENQTKAIERQIQAENKANAALERSKNTYNMVEQRIKILTQTYNNLATKKELGMKLNDSEVAQLNSLQGRLNQYNEVLKKVDAQIGKNQRNVGNYASGWNGLGNSINQITRELPAFTFSAQTGFLALSNNIPILADEIQRVSKNVAELRAQGQQVPSVMSQILTSFLSWQTALSIGVTLITVYGKEIGNLFAEMFKGSKDIDAAKIALKSYNEALKGGEYTEAYAKISKVNIAFRQAKDGVISKEQALKIYNEELGNVMGTTNDFNKAEQTFINQSRNFVEASLARAQANILIAKSAELSIKNREISNNAEVTFMEQVSAYVKSGGPFSKLFDPYSNKVLDERTKSFNNNTKEIEANQKEAEKLMETFSKLSKNLNFDKPENTNRTKGTTEKDNTERLRLEYEHQVSVLNLLEDGIDKEIELAKAAYEYQNTLDQGNKIKLITNLNNYLKQISDINDKYQKEEEERQKKENDEFLQQQEELFKEDEKNTKEYNEAVAYWDNWRTEKALEEASEREEIFLREVKRIKDYLAKSTDLGNFGFGSLNLFTQLEENGKTAFENMLENAEGFKEKFAVIVNAIGDIAKDVFNQMQERQNAYYEQQFKNLETEKDLAIKFAGENTAGREAIERQYEEKKRALQMEQAKQQKKMAIAQAGINIAMGITAALSQVPPYSFILAGLVGVLGAIQIANIQSTALPQFWMGTDNAPKGFALTQEKGAEIITDKNGKIKTLGNNKGAQLTYLNKGDKVFTADETTQKLNELLIGSGVAPIVNTEVNNGLTESQMRAIMQDTLAKQPRHSITLDEGGFKSYQEKQNKRTILKNRNVKI